jgi:hypothetical protein
MRDKGYSVDVRAGSVDDFKISNYPAMVHLRTHGGVGRIVDSPGMPKGLSEAFWTTTQVTDNNAASYSKDLKSGILAIMNENVSGSESEDHYGVTASFISNNWQLKSGAYVHASSCWLGARAPYDPNSKTACVPTNSGMQQAIFGRGARLFAGWSRATEVVAADKVARYVLDRMLGSNLDAPVESPPQRPMGAGSIKKNMASKGLDLNHVDQNGGWTSVFNFITPKSAGGRFPVDRLAPSITQLSVDTDKNELYVYGDLENYSPSLEAFRVSIGGTDQGVKRRQGNAIVCDFPNNASGAVQVRVEDRLSNRTRLSSWTVKMTYTITGPGGLKQEYKYILNLVGDVHQYREEAGAAPKTHLNYVSMLRQGSSGTFSGSGQFQDSNYKVVWTGGGTISPNAKATGCDGCFSFFGQTTPDTPKQLWWNIMVAMSNVGVSEKIYAWDSGKKDWTLTTDRIIGVTFPLDNSGMADTSDYDTGLAALKLPANILDDGTFQANTTGPQQDQMVGAGATTGWQFQHELKWETAAPVSGTEIDSDMPR